MSKERFLPPEVWSLVIENIKDYCFAWVILRRVSTTFRQVTEDVFARYVLHSCSITFTDACIRQLFSNIWFPGYPTRDSRAELHKPLEQFLQLKTLYFQPFIFAPTDSKTKVIFKLRNDENNHDAESANHFVEGGCWPDTRTFYLHSQCCTYSAPMDSTYGVAQHDRAGCLTPISSDQSAADGMKRLLENTHFVRLNGTLRCVRIPSIAVDQCTHVISVDWRLLCQEFYLDELRCRRAERPWLRYLDVDDRTSTMKVYTIGEQKFPSYLASRPKQHLLNDVRGHGWLFWGQSPTGDFRVL